MHHIPATRRPRLLESGTPADEYLRFARLVDTELLYHLEIADVRGRISNSKESELKLVEEFGARCREYGAWGDSLVGRRINK